MCDKSLNIIGTPGNPPAVDQPGGESFPVPLHFWQIEFFFKCPVVGLCLTFHEQKLLLKKEGTSLEGLSAFDIHERLVASAENENTLSRKVDNLLTRKFGGQAAPLRLLSEEAFMHHLRASFEAAQYVPVFWVAASRADLSCKPSFPKRQSDSCPWSGICVILKIASGQWRKILETVSRPTCS